MCSNSDAAAEVKTEVNEEEEHSFVEARDPSPFGCFFAHGPRNSRVLLRMEEEFERSNSKAPSSPLFGTSVDHQSPRDIHEDVKEEPFDEEGTVHSTNASDGDSRHDLHSDGDSDHGLDSDDAKFSPKGLEASKEPIFELEEDGSGAGDQLDSHDGDEDYARMRKGEVDAARNAKPYVCEVCKKKYSSKRYLNTIHMRTHSRDHALSCDICDKILSSPESLKYHTRVHTGKKPHACDLCSRRFRTKNAIAAHSRTHFENMFECKECSNRFPSIKTLRTHCKIRHE